MNRKREEEQQYLTTAVNFNLNMWRDSGEIDYLHKAIANIRAEIEREEIEDVVGIEVTAGNGVRVAKAVWDKKSGTVYCDCCKSSTLRYYTFCPFCGCYLLRDEEKRVNK